MVRDLILTLLNFKSLWKMLFYLLHWANTYFKPIMCRQKTNTYFPVPKSSLSHVISTKWWDSDWSNLCCCLSRNARASQFLVKNIWISHHHRDLKENLFLLCWVFWMSPLRHPEIRMFTFRIVQMRRVFQVEIIVL